MWRQQRGARGGRDAYALLLLLQLGRQIAALERKPPVTLALLAACFAAFYDALLPPRLRPPALGAACLQPAAVVQRGEWGRLLWAALLHADEYHLALNAGSLLWKGVQLEPRLGSAAFAALLAELLLLSHGLVVAVSAAAAYYVPEFGPLYTRQCAVGLSAVIFGLKVVLNHDAPGFSSVLGFSLPTKYLAWAELVAASLLNPRASWLGHLCGIAAGYAHVRWLGRGQPAAVRLWRQLRTAAWVAAPGRARFAAPAAEGGSGAGRPAAAAAAAAAARAPVRSGPAPPAAAAGPPGGAGVQAAGAAAPLSAEELRRRRLQRFG